MQEVVEKIRAEIGSRGVIPFRDFMELALYCPVYGFYEKEGDIIGRRGDFYTSPAVGPVFGELLARQFAEWLGRLNTGPIQIVESGAHDGALARDILVWLSQRRPQLFQRLEYRIIEPSSVRRARQDENLKDFVSKVSWLDGPDGINETSRSADARTPDRGVRGLIFSNELLDAMPVHRLGWDARAKAWFEWGVTWKNNKFAWVRLPHLTEAAVGAAPEISREMRDILPDGFATEICPAAWHWWKTAGNSLSEGRLVVVDYALEEGEFFAPERRDGTLRAYRQHRLASDVLADPGDQDITAHVNFSALRRIGEACGFSTEPLRDQGQFLTKIFAEMRAKGEDPGWTQTQVRQFQTLTHPEHLGRAFKVLVQRRN